MKYIVTAVVCLIVITGIIPEAVWGEDQSRQEELIERMIRIILENSPTLKSQERLVRESQELPEPNPTFAISGINFNVGAGFWNTDTNSFGFVPTLSLGMGLSFSNPARVLNSLNLKKEKEGTKQDYQKIKDSIISDLFTSVREILKLETQRKSLEELRIYLEDYSDLSEKQMKAGVIAPEPDKLWDLKERIIGTEVELQDAKNQLNTIRLEAAMRLGGDAWRELIELFSQLSEQI